MCSSFHSLQHQNRNAFARFFPEPRKMECINYLSNHLDDTNIWINYRRQTIRWMNVTSGVNDVESLNIAGWREFLGLRNSIEGNFKCLMRICKWGQLGFYKPSQLCGCWIGVTGCLQLVQALRRPHFLLLSCSLHLYSSHQPKIRWQQGSVEHWNWPISTRRTSKANGEVVKIRQKEENEEKTACSCRYSAAWRR